MILGSGLLFRGHRGYIFQFLNRIFVLSLLLTLFCEHRPLTPDEFLTSVQHLLQDYLICLAIGLMLNHRLLATARDTINVPYRPYIGELPPPTRGQVGRGLFVGMSEITPVTCPSGAPAVLLRAEEMMLCIFERLFICWRRPRATVHQIFKRRFRLSVTAAAAGADPEVEVF